MSHQTMWCCYLSCLLKPMRYWLYTKFDILVLIFHGLHTVDFVFSVFVWRLMQPNISTTSTVSLPVITASSAYNRVMKARVILSTPIIAASSASIWQSHSLMTASAACPFRGRWGYNFWSDMWGFPPRNLWGWYGPIRGSQTLSLFTSY